MGLFDKLLKEGKEALKEVTSEDNKQKASAFLNSLKETAKEGAETLKEAAKEAASEENREKASAFLNSLKDTLQEQAQEFKKTAEEMKAESRRETPAYSETAFEAPEDGKTCRERILDILAAEFPQYTVREDVSPQTIGGICPCRYRSASRSSMDNSIAREVGSVCVRRYSPSGIPST